MSLKGNLKAFPLSSVLQFLSNDQKTGLLHVKSNEKKVKVVIKNGAIIYAMGTQKEFRLGSILINERVITEEQLKECLNIGKAKNDAIGKVLVEKGYISVKTLKKISNKQVEEILYDLFLWQDGEFKYTDSTHDLNRIVETKLNTMSLILEASRRIDEMSVLKKHIPSENLVFKISESIKKKKELLLNLKEWHVLSIIDGKKTVKQVIKKSGLDEFIGYKILYSLVSSGLIEEGKKISLWQTRKSVDYSKIIKVYYETLRIAEANS